MRLSYLPFLYEIQKLLEFLKTSIEPWHIVSEGRPKTLAFRQEKSKVLANSSIEAWQITEFPCLSTENGFELVRHYYIYMLSRRS